MKPTITDSEKNCATRPSFSSPASMEISPASTARAAVITMNSDVLGWASRLTVANDIVATAEETATTRWRDEPRMAYISRPMGAA